MTVSKIVRNNLGDTAVKLRELAMRIEQGDISYVAVYAMDHDHKTDEVVMCFDEQPSALTA